jgi:hypothetical protein
VSIDNEGSERCIYSIYHISRWRMLNRTPIFGRAPRSLAQTFNAARMFYRHTTLEHTSVAFLFLLGATAFDDIEKYGRYGSRRPHCTAYKTVPIVLCREDGCAMIFISKGGRVVMEGVNFTVQEYIDWTAVTEDLSCSSGFLLDTHITWLFKFFRTMCLSSLLSK